MGERAEPPSKAGEPLALFPSPTDTIKGEDGSRLLLQSQMEIHVGSGVVQERKAPMNLAARTFPSHPNPVPWTPLKHHSSQPEPPIHPIPSTKGITGTLEGDELAARAAPSALSSQHRLQAARATSSRGSASSRSISHTPELPGTAWFSMLSVGFESLTSLREHV